MMKKILLSLALGLTSLFAAQAVGDFYLDRTGWSVTPCSEISTDRENGNGSASFMIDDDVNTYWHQDWGSDYAGNHWFIVDLGTSQRVDGFDYWPRQNSTNGRFNAGKVYVSENPFTFANHGAAKTYADNANNVPVGEFSFSYADNNDRGKKRCIFNNTATGRYVFVFISDSGNHACCGDFKLYTVNYMPPAELEATFNVGVTEKGALAQMLSSMKAVVNNQEAPDFSLPADLSGENFFTHFTSVATNLNNYINQFQNRQVSIKAGFRRQTAPYLAAVLTGSEVNFKTEATVTPDAVWTIHVKSNGILLYNRTTGYYINPENAPSKTGAQLLVPGVIKDTYVKFAKGATTQLLNIDNSVGNNLTSYQYIESDHDGSCWVVENASYNYVEPQTSTENEKHYYRIVNARWMFQNESPCLAANGENQAGSGIGEQSSRATASIPGIYWCVEADNETGNGAIRLVNLSGYKLAVNTADQNKGMMNEAGIPLYLVKQTDTQFNGVTCYGITKSSDATAAEYLDSDRYSGTAKYCWTPTNDGAGNNDNGSLWYFIPATAAEIANANTAYLSGVTENARVMLPADAELATLMGEDFMQTISQHYFTDADFETLTNAVASKLSVPTRTAAIKAAVEEAVGSKLTAGYMIKNRNSRYTNNILTAGLNEEGDSYQTTPTAATNDLNAIWSFTPNNDGYIIRSVGSDKALARTEQQSKAIPLTQEGLTYTIGYNPTVPGFNFTLMPQTEGENMRYFALHQSNNELVCKWEAQNVPGSHWSINPLTAATVEIRKDADNNGHVIVLAEGVTVNNHSTAAELVLTITKTAGAGAVATAAVDPVEGVYTIKASEFENNRTLNNMTEGEYVLTAPAGYFLDNGVLAGAVNYTFNVDSEGTPSGIEEETAASSADVIYDLQGRRVSKAGKGVYIINGKKVFVK